MLLLLVPGCSNYVCYIQNLFIPAGKVCHSVDEIQSCVVRTIPIRPDGLMTLDIIHVVYKSDGVIDFHERLLGDCSGEREDSIEEKITQQQALNQEKTIFFISLYGQQSDWSCTLEKDGHVYKATAVKIVDLDHIYQRIIGKDAVHYHQSTYQVTFDAAMVPPFDFVVCNGAYRACASFDCI